MNTKLFNKIYLLAFLPFIGCIVALYYDHNLTACLLFLFTIAMFNVTRETEEDYKWNDGICAKTNEPWEFDAYDGHGESSTIFFKSQKESFSASPRSLFIDTYKGKFKWFK